MKTVHSRTMKRDLDRNIYHTPVLLTETIELLRIKKGHWYVDATAGGGGHTEQILKG